MKKRLFIISNRLPVNVVAENDKALISLSSGGLVSAISSYIEYAKENYGNVITEKFWVGVSGCSQATWRDAKTGIQNSEFEYLPIFINQKVYDQYYNGMSNSVIWPLFHYFPSYAEYNVNYYDNYLQANKEFLDVIVRYAKETDVIWIHDYHLMPLAGMIREHFPNITIGFFLHIPFPSYELFRLMPGRWQEELLKGVLGADLIGFHTIDYASHFLKTIQMVLGFDNERHIIKYKNRLLKIDVFPISIDHYKFNTAYNIKEVAVLRRFYHKQFSGKKIIFSVDRLDYTKGVFNRLKAYERFLNTFTEYREKVVFILVIVPSRDSIKKYADRKREIDEFIGGFNSKTGSIIWKPIIYQYSHLDFTELVALYTACDLALITPLRDGMNLVAKEFVSSRQDLKGVLLLSEMAGAARELTDALMINPNDINGLALKIKEGLEMEVTDQARRLALMQKRIAQYNVNTWAEDFLSQLGKIKQKQKEFEFMFLDNEAKLLLLDKYRKSQKRLLLLDYDGTIVPFSSFPDLSKPDKTVLNLLKDLSADGRNQIYIISGRDSETLQNWLGHLPLNLIAEHGAMIKSIANGWQSDFEFNIDENWKSIIGSVMESYVKRCANSFIEIKNFSVVWHYRNAAPEQAKIRCAELFSELTEHSNYLNVQVVQGNKVVEVRIKGIDKAYIVKKLLKENYDFILACGDDTTDEEMFRMLANNQNAFTIKIGDEASFAKYNLYTPQMTVSLLKLLANSVSPVY